MRNLWILTRFLLKSGPGKSNQKSGKKKAFSDGGRIVVYLLLGVCLLPVSVLLFLLGYSGYTFLQPLGLETLLIEFVCAIGMCDAGRIKHHLKHNLWRQESTVLFVGYQAVGTLGRALIGGAKEVKLFQEEVHVNAHIIQFPGMSGHADQEGLLKWAGSLRAKPDRVFVTHGEDKVTEIFAEKLWDEFRYPAMAPFSGTVFDLKENEFIEKNVGIPIQKETTANAGTLRTRSSGNAVFDRLVAAGQRLLTVITRNKGGANKDLSKFADQINSLCDKWDR